MQVCINREGSCCVYSRAISFPTYFEITAGVCGAKAKETSGLCRSRICSEERQCVGYSIDLAQKLDCFTKTTKVSIDNVKQMAFSCKIPVEKTRFQNQDVSDIANTNYESITEGDTELKADVHGCGEKWGMKC